MFPRQPPAIPVVMPYMEAAGIEPAQGSPGEKCVACPSPAEYVAELESDTQFVVCGTCLKTVERTWIYFVSGGGHVKIGYSADPVARLRAHQSGSPVPLTIAYLIEGPRLLESFFHRAARDFRAHGEWFRDCNELWELVASPKFRRDLREYREHVADVERERRVTALLEATA